MIFECRVKEILGDRWVEVEDRFADQAAEKIAKQIFEDDPCDPEFFEITVEVRDAGTVRTFVVNAEPEVQFFATEN